MHSSLLHTEGTRGAPPEAGRRWPLIAALAVLLIFTSCIQETPEDALRAFVHAVSKKDWASTWNRLSSSTQHDFIHNFQRPLFARLRSCSSSDLAEAGRASGLKKGSILALSPRDLFVLTMRNSTFYEAMMKKFNNGEPSIEFISLVNDRAVVRLKQSAGEVVLVHEMGGWRVELK